jgi:outer membrane protein assembly factor BamB
MPGGKLLALDAASGASRWEVAVGEPRGATELERIVDISGMPFVSGRDVCAAAFQGRIGCFDVSTGTARWTRDYSSNVSLGVDERFVFAVDERSKLTAFSRLTGQNAWQNDRLANRRLSTPVSFGRAVAAGDLQGYIHLFSREDGSIIGRVGIDTSPIQSVPVVAGSNLIFQTQAGTVVAIATE